MQRRRTRCFAKTGSGQNDGIIKHRLTTSFSNESSKTSFDPLPPPSPPSPLPALPRSTASTSHFSPVQCVWQMHPPERHAASRFVFANIPRLHFWSRACLGKSSCCVHEKENRDATKTASVFRAPLSSHSPWPEHTTVASQNAPQSSPK